MRKVYREVRRVLAPLLASPCLLCGAPIPGARALCPPCEAGLPRLSHACPRCAAPLPTGGAAPCGRCQRGPAPAYARTLALYRYGPPIDRLIQALKYHQRLPLAAVLGERLADFLAPRAHPRPDRIVPVPLHASRLRQRGYNQALELARPVARRLRIALDYRSARRIRPTAPQAGLPERRRQGNVRGAFAVAGAFTGERIAILDDVMTSGHTVNALAAALRRAGAREVEVWVIARA